MSTPTPPPASPPPRGPGRARRAVRSGGRVLFALAAIGIATIAWLLTTVGGRDTLLARVVDLLPAGALTWERAEGVVRGPLVLHGVSYRDGGIAFTAERVLLVPDLLPVLGRRLQLDRLVVENAVLTLPAAADEPFRLPEWPGSLPHLAMPFELRVTQLEWDGLAIRRGDEPPVVLHRIEGTLLRTLDDGLRADALTLAGDFGRATLRGEYRPAQAFRSAFSATWQRAAVEDAPAVSLWLEAHGDPSSLDVELTGTAPERLTATLALRGDPEVPDWTFALRVDGIDPVLLGAAPGEPWRGTLDAQGHGGEATLEGNLVVAGEAIAIEPSTLALADGLLRASPLQLGTSLGPLTVEGTLRVEDDVDAVDGEAADESSGPAFDLVARSDAIVLRPRVEDADAATVTVAGEVRARGDFADWTLAGDATLRRAGETAQVELDGRGDGDALRVETLAVRMPGGTLDGHGRWAWSPHPAFALEARLAGFDPGYFFADYPGAIAAMLVVDGERVDGGWRGELRADGLAGELRGRALSGFVESTWHGRGGRVDADVGLGESRVQVVGAFGDAFDLQADFAPLRLEDVVADARGRLDGRLALRGPRGAVDVDVDLQGHDLTWNDDRAARLQAQGRLPARAGDGALHVEAETLVVAGLALDRATLEARGHQADLQLQLDAAGGAGTLALAGRLAHAADTWRGRVDTLRLDPRQGPALALDQPFAFRAVQGGVAFDRACVNASDGGRLCAEGDGRALAVDADGVPLALLQPWLPVDEAVALQAFGTVDAQLRLRRPDARWLGDGSLQSREGGLRLADELDHVVFAYRDLQLRFASTVDAIDGTLKAGLADGGRIEASLRTGHADTAPVAGTFALDVRDLAWLELFSEDLAAPVGHLTGTLSVAGTRALPELSGTAKLAGFAAELPGLGVRLVDGGFDLVGRADGKVHVDGRVRSGDGVLLLAGDLDFRDDAAPVTLGLRGDDVTIASTAELFAVADPDLQLRWLPDMLEVRGTLAVDEARADLESLDSSVAVSPDVVVVDAAATPTTRERPLDLEVVMRLGDDVRLIGFGLDGRMRGEVTYREAPGRRATGEGTLDVEGTYRAYGQSLVIERARLGYGGGRPFDDPTLDIRAERDFDEVTVGVRVRGTARRPETSIVSNPAMDTSEALSWLVLGRPITTTTGGESQRLGAAAIALGAGGNLVAQQIGARLGLDEAGVVDSRNLGGATFTVGKYVSPRLFLSYGVSLIGTGQVVTLKYLLARGFDVSVESGNENAASFNWRTER